MSRYYLQAFLEDSGSETLREITSPASPQVIPDMLLASAAPVPAIGANTVVFQKSAQNIPIFGGRVVVDIDSNDKSLVCNENSNRHGAPRSAVGGQFVVVSSGRTNSSAKMDHATRGVEVVFRSTRP